MAANKVHKMSQTRESIEALCTILNTDSPTKVSAENFRLAKFDKVDATPSLWYTLHTLLVKGRVARTDENNRRMVTFCKHEMFYKGYRVVNFFQLPGDMTYGSRELLLALGWLIAKENIVGKVVNNVKPLVFEDPPVKVSLLERIPLPAAMGSFGTVAGEQIRLNPAELGNYMLMCYGKLHSCLKSLVAAQREYTILINKMHSIPNPKKSENSSHMSPLDVYFLRHPSELSQYQRELERFCSNVKAFLHWSEHELAFWTWMESVLDGKISDSEKENDIEESDILQERQPYMKPSIVLQNVKVHQVKLSQYFNAQEQIYRKVSKSWKKMKACWEPSEQEGGSLADTLSRLDRQLLSEIKEVQKDSQISQEPCKENKSRAPLCFKKLNQDEKKTTNASKDASRHSMALEEIARLTEQKKVLEGKLQTLQKKHKTRLLSISQAKENLICIPPDGMM